MTRLILPSLRGSDPGATSVIFGLRPTISLMDEATRFLIASIAEIAEKFGFTESKVTAMLHRTRTALRRYLKEEGLC